MLRTLSRHFVLTRLRSHLPKLFSTRYLDQRTALEDFYMSNAPPLPTQQRLLEDITSLPVVMTPPNQLKTPQEYISEVEPIEVDGPVAVCDGGDLSLGHPVEYIQLNKVKDEPETCKYCGLRFIQKHHVHH